jgi:hypothetical protein
MFYVDEGCIDRTQALAQLFEDEAAELRTLAARAIGLLTTVVDDHHA